MRMLTAVWRAFHFAGFVLSTLTGAARAPSLKRNKSAPQSLTLTPAKPVPIVDTLASEIENFHLLDPHAQIDAVRNWLYGWTNLAADEETLLAYDRYPLHRLTVNEMLELHRSHTGGHLCAGINYILKRVYDDLGYRSWMYNYGDRHSLTHAITLVEVNRMLYAQDAYFNLTYVDLENRPLPFYVVLENLTAGKEPKLKAGPTLRRNIHMTVKLKRAGAGSWAARGIDPQTCKALNDKYLLCETETSLNNFIKAFPRWNDVYAFLAKHGFPKSFQYLLLFPIGVTGEEWIENPAKNEILRRITEIREKVDRVQR
jgi:hypothetical protein